MLERTGIAGDRAFAVVDPQGRLVNGKRVGAFATIHPDFDVATGRLALRFADRARGLRRSRRSANRWRRPSSASRDPSDLSSARGARRSPPGRIRTCGSSRRSAQGEGIDRGPSATLLSTAALATLAHAAEQTEPDRRPPLPDDVRHRRCRRRSPRTAGSAATCGSATRSSGRSGTSAGARSRPRTPIRASPASTRWACSSGSGHARDDRTVAVRRRRRHHRTRRGPPRGPDRPRLTERPGATPRSRSSPATRSRSTSPRRSRRTAGSSGPDPRPTR